MKRDVRPDRPGSRTLSGATGGGAASVVAAALDAIVVIDQRGRILDFNPAAERMFGHLRAEVLERDVADVIIPPEMRQRHRDGMARHLRTGTTTILDRPVEMVALRADGSRFPIELSIVRFDQAGTPTFTAFIRDITEARHLLDALRRHSSRLTAIVRAQQELADAGLTPPELRARIASAAQSVFGGDGAAFELIEDAQFVYRAACGIAAPHEGLRLPLDASLSGLALRTRRALASQDTAVDPRVDQAQCRAVGIRSLAVAPVFLLQRPAGILKVMSSRPGAFDNDDANALELFAASVGTILQRGEHEQERQRTALMRERIVAAQQEIAASGDALEPLLERVAAQVQALLGADGALLLRPRDGALQPAAAAGCVAGEEIARLPLEHSFAGRCLEQTGVLRGEPELASGAEADLWSRCGVRSALGAALRAQDETFGVLQVLWRRPDSGSEHDAHDLHLLVEALGAALQRREAAARLRRSEQQYRMLFDHNPHPMWVYEVGTLRFLAVNLAAEQAYGFSREEFLGMTLRDIRPAEDVPALEAQLAGLPEQRTFRSLRRHRRRDGTLIDVEVTSDPILFEDRQARLVMAHDVTARLRAEAGQASANRAQRILSACTSAMIRIGDEKRLLEEICRIIVEIGGYRLAGVGYAQDDAERSLLPMAAAGMHAEHVGRMRLSWGADSPWGQGPAGRTVRSGKLVVEPDLLSVSGPFSSREAALQLGFRSAITLPLSDEARCFGFLGLFSEHVQDPQAEEIALLQELAENISFGIGALRAERERLAVERKLAFHASHDATTGLLRYEMLEPEVAVLLSDDSRLTAVLVIDVDRFKAVNESLGHLVGDHVLGVLAARIKSFEGPGVLVSHFAADQYLVALGASTVEAAIALAEHIRAAIAVPIEQDGYRLVLSVTIGLSHAPAHGCTPLELTRAAQAAAERGKTQGRDLVSVFDTEQLREIDDRVTLGSRLRLAVQRNELSLHFQPQFRARERRLTGFEALLRWSSPELGMVSPARFIPLAEALGLMPEIGAWVVRDACRQARAWLDEGRTGFCIAVNASAQQLQRAGLVETVAAAIAEFSLPPHMLDIELTESSLMENVARVQGTLAELKQLGVTLSLDDFGTGYSSLAYLKNFSLDKLKIDQSFVRGLPGNPDDAAIARMIVAIGHQLRLVVSAEGVETADQADFLRDIDCDELQGYFLGRPVVADAAQTHFGATPPG